MTENSTGQAAPDEGAASPRAQHYHDDDRDGYDYMLIVEPDPVHEPGSVEFSVSGRYHAGPDPLLDHLGGITLSRADVVRLHAQLGAWLAPKNPHGQMGWSVIDISPPIRYCCACGKAFYGDEPVTGECPGSES